MIHEDDLSRGMADAIRASRESLDISDELPIDQVIILVSYLLPSGETISASSPVVRQDSCLGQNAMSVATQLGIL